VKSSKLLIIEDEVANQSLLQRLLAQQYELLCCSTAEEGWELLNQETDIKLVLLDLNLPGMNGFELLKRIRTEVRFKLLPVLILTGMTDVGDETRGLALGASDYIHKPLRPEAVRVRIANQLQLAEQQRQLEELAVKDPLTGLYNRRGFLDIFERELARAKRTGTPLSLAMVDVDYFKRYNDHYGHPQGDRALVFIGQHLQAVARRAADLCARIGGEEFLLLWPETPAKGALQQAEKLRRALELDGLPHAASDISNSLTVSIGGITLEAGDYDANLALQAVDDALYEAKHQGRNRVVWRANSD